MFVDKQGVDGGGLTREVVSCFWHMFRERLMEGEEEKVSISFPNMVTRWGGSYRTAFSIPVTLPTVSMQISVGFPTSCYNHFWILLLSLNLICWSVDVIVPILSGFNCMTGATTNNFCELMFENCQACISLSTLFRAVWNQKRNGGLASPLPTPVLWVYYFVPCESKRGMVDSHPKLW